MNDLNNNSVSLSFPQEDMEKNTALPALENSSHHDSSSFRQNEKTEVDFIVDFDGPNDPYSPLNWPLQKKILTSLLYGFTTWWCTWNSSMSVSTALRIFVWLKGTQIFVGSRARRFRIRCQPNSFDAWTHVIHDWVRSEYYACLEVVTNTIQLRYWAVTLGSS